MFCYFTYQPLAPFGIFGDGKSLLLVEKVHPNS